MEYQICSRCVMDTSEPEIYFNKKGICNHCIAFDEITSKQWFPNEYGSKKLIDIFTTIKKEGIGKQYDCILGLSGGIDSSYLALKLYEAGIRPLVIHVDGGWNTELAVQNIEKIIKYCKWNLYTIVIDWEEMKDLQLAYLKSGVVNQDVPQDHAFFASLYHFAVRHNINYVINGSNISTECILPKSWVGNIAAMDSRNLKAIYAKYGTKKLKKYKTISFFEYYIYYPYIKKMKKVSPLNFMPYIKTDALKYLQEKIGYKAYDRKHGESVFTVFYQNYWLPMKFGYDKRRAHLSSLILTKQITREQAIKELEKPLYDPIKLQEDIEYVAKKLGVNIDEFQNILKAPCQYQTDFPSYTAIYNFSKKLYSIFKK